MHTANTERHANSIEPQQGPPGFLDDMEESVNLISLVGNKAIKPD